MAKDISKTASAIGALFPPVLTSLFIELLSRQGASNIWTVFLVNVGIQLVGFIHSAAFHTEKFYDLCGSLGFASVTLVSFAELLNSSVPTKDINVRNWVNSLLVVMWAARLGSHLFGRIQHDQKDKRFDKMRDSGFKLALPWSMQLAWATLVPSSVLLINTMQHESMPVSPLDVVGWVIFTVGWLLEVIADEQKKEFRSHESNKDKFIQEGLWKRSRHPNYFGEMSLWFGIWISCTSAFQQPTDYITVIGPVLNASLLRFVSGVPLLEASADRKWGHLPEYQKYKQETPMLIPKFW